VAQIAEDIRSELLIPTRGGVVSIAVPAKEIDDTPLLDKQNRWAIAALGKLSMHFRGATAFDVHTGAYMQDSGKTQYEDTVFIQSFAPKSVLEDFEVLSDLVDFCLRMRSELNQESVLLAINSTAFFVEA